MCGGLCMPVHLSCTTPPKLFGAAFQMYDQDVRRRFSSCTAVDTSYAAWRQAIVGLSKGGLGLRSLYQHTPTAYVASKLGLDHRQIFTSVPQLQILILLFHLVRHCTFTPFSKHLRPPKKSFLAHWSICCWKHPPQLTEHDCSQFLHHMHPPGCPFYNHRGWVYILIHQSIMLP